MLNQKQGEIIMHHKPFLAAGNFWCLLLWWLFAFGNGDNLLLFLRPWRSKSKPLLTFILSYCLKEISWAKHLQGRKDCFLEGPRYQCIFWRGNIWVLSKPQNTVSPVDSIKVNSWAPYPKILIFIFLTVKHCWGRIQRINSSLGDFIIWFLDQKFIFQFFTLKAYIHTSKRMGLPQLASKKKWCPYCKTQDALLHDIMTLSSYQSTRCYYYYYYYWWWFNRLEDMTVLLTIASRINRGRIEAPSVAKKTAKKRGRFLVVSRSFSICRICRIWLWTNNSQKLRNLDTKSQWQFFNSVC